MDRNLKPRILGSKELLQMVIAALDDRAPFSVISVGITESFVLAQYTVLKEAEFMGHKEAWVAAQGVKRGFDHRGIRFPNTAARDLAVEALGRADVIGYNLTDGKNSLAEKVFQYYRIRPRYVFESNVRRVIMFSQPELFERMLAKRRILIACSYAEEVKAAMDRNLKERLGFEVVGTVKMEEFEDLPQVKADIAGINFDLCLIAAGINAVILAPYIAKFHGKVAFDLGMAMESFITGEIEMGGYLDKYIGLNNLMKM